MTLAIINYLDNNLSDLIITSQKNGNLLLHKNKQKYIVVNPKLNRVEIDDNLVYVAFNRNFIFMPSDDTKQILFNYISKKYNLVGIEFVIAINLSTTGLYSNYVFK